jgi:hypothetical protein
MEPDIIWENVVSSGAWKVQVESIGENMWRGNLKIYDVDDNLQYQREVSITRGLQEGGTEVNFREWEKVITTWIHQFS